MSKQYELLIDEQREKLNKLREIISELGFLFVTLDLKGYRTGSMNATLTV